MKKAVRFEVKKIGQETIIVIFDKKDKLIVGDSHWDGDFDCSYNNLTSLEGCPSSIGGYFYCYNNNLTSLKGSPNSIGRNFNCTNNNLASLEGCPSSIGGNFYCTNNNLTKFPKEIFSKYKDCDLIGNKFEVDPSDTELINLLTSKKWSFVLLERNTLSRNL